MDNKNISPPESKQNKGKQEYGNEIVDDAELKKGMKVEAEHADLIEWLKAYHTNFGKFPDDETIYAQIAKAHLEEDPSYYKELAKMENKNGMKEDVIADYKKELESLEFDVKHDPTLLDQGWKEKIAAMKKKIAEVEKMNSNPLTPEAKRNEGSRLYGSK